MKQVKLEYGDGQVEVNVPDDADIFETGVTVKDPPALSEVRAAGNFAQLTSREGSYCVIKLPSGETRQIRTTTWSLMERQDAADGSVAVHATVVS